MPWSLSKFLIKRVGVVDSGDNPAAEVLLFKSEQENPKNKGGVNMVKTYDELVKELPKEDAEVVDTELNKFREEIKKSQEELAKALVKPTGCDQAEWDAADTAGKLKLMGKACGDPLKKEEPKEEPVDELIKSADPKIQEYINKIKAESELNKADAEKAKLEKAEKDAELKKELISKEADMFPNIGATKEDLIKLFTNIEDGETSKLLKAVLKADNEALTDNKMIKSVGVSGDPADKKASDEVEEKAQELIKSGEAKTIEIAKTKIYKKYPDLLKKIREEE